MSSEPSIRDRALQAWYGAWGNDWSLFTEDHRAQAAPKMDAVLAVVADEAERRADDDVLWSDDFFSDAGRYALRSFAAVLRSGSA